MTEQKNQAPLPISDEDLDAATGGAIGINPLLLLASGGQGIYMQSAEPAAATSSTLTHGTNPLFVETAHVPLVMPTYTPPTHDVAPTPTPAVTQPTAAVPAHDSTVLVVSPSGMGQSLDIPSHAVGQIISSSITISGTVGISNTMTIDNTPPSVTVMTFDQHPGAFTPIVATVDPVRSGGYVPHVGASSPLEKAFDLHLVSNK